VKKVSMLCVAALIGAASVWSRLDEPASAQQPSPPQQTPVAPQDAPALPHKADASFLKYSPDMNLGEVLGVAVNSKGQILVLNHPGSANAGPIWMNATTQLLLFGPDGKFIKEIGKGVYGIAYSHQVRYDKYDNLWVVDKAANTVIRFNPEGYVTMNLGRREEGYHGLVELPRQADARPSGGYLNGATDVGWDRDENIFVSDGYVNSRVAKFDKNGNFLKEWGSFGREQGQFNLPHAMVLDREGNVYVADRNNSRIQVFDANGTFKRIMYLNVPYPADYQPPFSAVNPSRQVRDRTQPWAMCITNTTPQQMWVADNEPGRIYKMTLDGKILGWIGSSGRQVGQFNWIHGLDCSQPDVLYVADMNNWRVQRITFPAQGTRTQAAR
jgi:DNA-binding beta-propeller fold protein YncE